MRSFRCVVMVALLATTSLYGCTDMFGEADLPVGIIDPAKINTPDGALGLYRHTVALFGGTLSSIIIESGLAADELESDQNVLKPLDLRNGSGTAYKKLHALRTQSAQAIQTLEKYGEGLPEALRGELYAIQGYAVMFLADMYCSGVPLSTTDFEQDFTYRPGSTTEQLYQHALASFDTASSLSTDSARIRYFASVGRGRALLALSRYAEAETAIRDVPSDFEYRVRGRWDIRNSLSQVSVADRQGGNGMAFRSNSDPRSLSDPVTYAGKSYLWPRKFPRGHDTTLIIASRIEAQLITAEAKLREGDIDGWLMILKDLRQNPITQALPVLEDPGAGVTPADSATYRRVTLLFEERAYWLFLTGHRQGDLRRLIRQYRRPVDLVFPVGPYPDGLTDFDQDPALPVPDEEFRNPLFTGCFTRDA